MLVVKVKILYSNVDQSIVELSVVLDFVVNESTIDSSVVSVSVVDDSVNEVSAIEDSGVDESVIELSLKKGFLKFFSDLANFPFKII